MLAVLFSQHLQMALSQRNFAHRHNVIADSWFEGGSTIAQQTQHLQTQCLPSSSY